MSTQRAGHIVEFTDLKDRKSYSVVVENGCNDIHKITMCIPEIKRAHPTRPGRVVVTVPTKKRIWPNTQKVPARATRVADILGYALVDNLPVFAN